MKWNNGTEFFLCKFCCCYHFHALFVNKQNSTAAYRWRRMGRLWILHAFKIFLVEKPSSYNCKQLRWAIICVSELSVAVLAVILSGKILTLSLNPPPFNSITSLSWLVLQNQYKPATSDMNCLRLSVWLLSNADFTEQCST